MKPIWQKLHAEVLGKKLGQYQYIQWDADFHIMNPKSKEGLESPFFNLRLAV